MRLALPIAISDEWLKAGTDPAEPVVDIVCDAIGRAPILETIAATAIQGTGVAAVETRYAEQLQELQRQLGFLIPPNEYWDPIAKTWKNATAATVLNAIAQFWRSDCPGWERWGRDARLDRLNDIGVKALELVELQATIGALE